jgi:cellulose synthase/poly-beta-1,6-N-acetylglucosamine synthase-like glycosyltransferase
MTALEIVFWASVALILYTEIGYAVLLAALAAILRRRAPGRAGPAKPAGVPGVSVIVAAYAEEKVIGARIENLRALDYPASSLEIIVACDGSPDTTAEHARAAGADLVLELPRGGKVRAQDAAVLRAHGQILAFTDANAAWEPNALSRLVAAFADPRVGYVCGDVRYADNGGTNQEGLYWRYEMVLRRLESALRSVTGGNGAIYATRRESYIEVDPIMGHDLSFPFNMVKRGWLAVYEPAARSVEKMVPSIEGEFARKRRMMSHGWAIVLRGGMLAPRGYDPLYALMIFSHRVLRYALPLLHLIVFATSILLLGEGPVYAVAVAIQAAVLVAALAAGVIHARPLLIARYYVLTIASLAAGLWDWLAHGTSAGWEPAEGTR